MAVYTFYLDIYSGQLPGSCMYATTQPGTKIVNTSRYAFDVEIPDSVFLEVQGNLNETPAQIRKDIPTKDRKIVVE